MRKSEEPSSFYYEAINLIDLDDYDGAINSIKKNIDSLENPDDIEGVLNKAKENSKKR